MADVTAPDSRPVLDLIAASLFHEQAVCFDHAATSERPTWCCVCGEHDLQVTWYVHVAAAVLAACQGAIKAEGVREAADEWSEFEVFDAPDGHKAIRQHEMEPDEWLRAWADRKENG